MIESFIADIVYDAANQVRQTVRYDDLEQRKIAYFKVLNIPLIGASSPEYGGIYS